jgi:DsbC/DsbD-like thiol-disulfide interchange protein
MLSDKGSKVIREFGILNTNVPEGHPFYGIPFPGDYMIGTDGTIQAKFFLPEYQTRVASSEILMQRFGEKANGSSLLIKSEDLQARIILSTNHAAPGQQIGVVAEFTLSPGWHIYGQPLPANYTPTAVTFDVANVAKQSVIFPQAEMMTLASLKETLPVYTGSFEAQGNILIKPTAGPGEQKIKGTLAFQECNDSICRLPQKLTFEIPFKVDSLTPAAKSDP